jgi:hypothetical protein
LAGYDMEVPVRGIRHVASLLREVWYYAREHKAWWIVPTTLLLLIMGLLIVSGQAVAPFIYTLF